MTGNHQLLVLKERGADLYDIHNGQLGTAKPLDDSSGLLVERYGANCAYLIRPDRYITAITGDVSKEALNQLATLTHHTSTDNERAA